MYDDRFLIKNTYNERKETMKKATNKVIYALISVTVLFILFAVSAFAAVDLTGAYFYGDTDKDPMTYEVGETMTFTVSLKSSSGTLISVPKFFYSFKGDDGVTSSGTVSGESGTLTVSHKITCPGFVRLTVYALDENGGEIKVGNTKVHFEGGACAEWEKIEMAMAEPDDFDAYWERCLAELDTVAPDIFELKEASESNSSYKVYDLYVNCVGSKNFLNTAAEGEEPNGATYVAGKLTIPTTVPEGGYKFYLSFQGAGVYLSPGVSKKPGYITLCVYAHSMELSRDQAYIDELNGGLLSGYMRRALYNDNAEESYTKYMILRDLQAVRFLKKCFGEEGMTGTYNGIDVSAWKGLWNGKDIELYGQSQGGFQCIAVAALDHDITYCNPWVPCWCDMYATTYFPTRRTVSLIYEHYSQKYFDSVSLGKGIVCRTQVDTGFGDDTCPTTGVIAAYNAMTCEKTLNIYQGMEHYCSTNYKASVAKQKYTSGTESFKLPYSASFDFEWEIASVEGDALTFSGSTVTAAAVGTATVNFADANRYPVTVEVEPAISDYVISSTASDAVLNGMADAIYTRTGKIMTAVSSSDLPDKANVLNGNIYYVISDFDGTLDMTASEMYDEFTASGADYLVLILGDVTSKTTAAMLAMHAQPSVYPKAFVCSGINELSEDAAGRAAGNNIVTAIDANRPVLDSGVKIYDVNTGDEVKALSILADGEILEFAVVPNSVYNKVSVSADGVELDSENAFAILGDADGGSIIVNNAEYIIYPDAVASGTEENYSWLIDSAGKLTILSGDNLALTGSSFSYLDYADQITEIEVKVGASSIGSGAFAGVEGLIKITLPYSLDSIAEDAISGASGYTVYGYENNTAATEFAASAGVTFVSLGACGSAGDNLVWEYRDNTLYITGTGTIVTSGITGYGKQSLSPWYSYYNNITKVVLCDSVTTIAGYTFHMMPALTHFEATKNLTAISGGAFENAGKLSAFYIAGNEPVTGTLDLSYVTNMSGGYQFDGCKVVKNVIFSENLVTPIGDKFIGYNDTITSITIPASVPSLASRALFNMTALKELTVMGAATAIPDDLQTKDNNTTRLSAIYGRSGSSAANYASKNNIAFYDLTGDKYDGDITAYGDVGTNVYWKLIENEISGTYTLYFYGTGSEIVSGCDENGGEAAPWAAYADAITKVVYRGSISSMGAYNLSGLTALEVVEFEGCDITAICTNAFSGTGLSGRFTLPEGVASVEANAFDGCTELTEIATAASEITFADGALDGSGVNTVYGRYKTGAEDYAVSNSLTFNNINDILPVASGLCFVEGALNTIWEYDKETKVLTFTSNKTGWNECGAIKYASDGIGWTAYINEIEKVIVGDGLAKVSQTAFQNHTALKVIELPASLAQIDGSALRGCTSLDTIYRRGYAPIEGTADLSKISTLYTQSSVYVNCAFDTVILGSSVTAVKDGTFSGTPIKTVICNSDTVAALALTVFGEDTSIVTGYSEGNMVWTFTDGELTVYTVSTPAAVDSFAAIADSVTSITFEKESDITALKTGVFDAFPNLTSVLFRCDAPESADALCFGSGSIRVYYAADITSFPDASWNGYICLEEGSTIDYIAVGKCKTDGYDWSLDTTGLLTISGSGSGTLEFDVNASYDSLSSIPWYKYASSVKKVVIEESTGITTLSQYSLSNLPVCETIVIPSVLTDLGAYDIFCSNPALKTIAVHGSDFTEGVIDLRNVTRINPQLFEVSFKNTTPEIYLPANPASFTISKWAKDCESLTFVTYPTCTAATYIRNLIDTQTSSAPNANTAKNIVLKYYTEEQDSTLTRTGEQTTNYGKLSWSFDDATGKLAFANTGSGWNEFLYNSNSTAFKAWKEIWKDAVVHIEIAKFSKLQFNGTDSLFAKLINLETVRFEQESVEWQFGSTGEGFFENCYSLTTLGFGSTYTEGVIDLSHISKYTGSTQKNMFKNCTSITNVKFHANAPTVDANNPVSFNVKIANGMFCGCTSLEAIELPAYFTTIEANAFAGCTALTSLTLNSTPAFADATVFPDNEGQKLVVHCPDKATADAVAQLGYTYTKPLYLGNLATAITMDGYAVRLEKYNGLRGLFTFDNDVKAENKENGFELVEYGAILVSGVNYTKYGRELTLVGDTYVTADSRVKKIVVYEGDVKKGNTLSTSDENYTRYAASIVNYSNNFTTDVHICGYEIWRTAYGVDVIHYTDHANDNYDLTSIYDISVDMYRDGIINSENDIEGIVWNVLVNNGAVTLTAGTDYVYTDGMTDLDGNSMAGSFTFKNVPAVSQSVSGGVVTGFTKSDLTITLLRDGDKYLAVYRGNGSVPKADAWAAEGVAGNHQLSSNFCGATPPAALPNPKLTAAAAAKINTVVLDYGISSTGSASFAKLESMEKLVYSSTLKTLGGAQFTYCKSLKTAYMADVTNPEFNYIAAQGKIDFRPLTSVGMSYMFTCCSSAEYIYLPKKVGTNGNGCVNSCSSLKGLTCGDASMIDGRLDFSKTGITVFGDKAFRKTVLVTELMSPETVTAFYDKSGSTLRHAFEESSVKKIHTETEVPAITEYVSSYGSTFGLTYDYEWTSPWP